jgi:hypothetical protein
MSIAYRWDFELFFILLPAQLLERDVEAGEINCGELKPKQNASFF